MRNGPSTLLRYAQPKVEMNTKQVSLPVVWTLFLTASLPVMATEPLPQAHAHNDYHHRRPLFDALDHGFCSVEADIFVVGDELLVAHNREDLEPARTLRALYLDPLKARVKANGGRVYRDGPRFTLLIDFKSPGEPTYRVLRDVLADYRDMLFKEVDGRRQPGAVSIVISGNRPMEMIAADQQRLCGIDGRLSDLETDMSAALMPLISDHWGNHFHWRGEGEMSSAEQQKLRSIVQQSHAAGRRVRFWATPESEKLWEQLVAAGVDHINTDQLGRLQTFLQTRIAPTQKKSKLCCRTLVSAQREF